MHLGPYSIFICCPCQAASEETGNKKEHAGSPREVLDFLDTSLVSSVFLQIFPASPHSATHAKLTSQAEALCSFGASHVGVDTHVFVVLQHLLLLLLLLFLLLLLLLPLPRLLPLLLPLLLLVLLQEL